MLAGVFVAALACVEIDRIDPASGPANLRGLVPYWIMFAGLWSTLGLLAWRLGIPATGHTGSDRCATTVVLAVAVLVRVAAVFTNGPQLSDDLWRYVHDGGRLAAGWNPYAMTPAQLGAGQGEDPILDRVNHPHLITIYQPMSQWVFALLWLVHPRQHDPLGVHTFRLGFVGFDLMVIGLILLQLRRLNRSPWWATLYAWHPLAISETAGSGHQDPVGIAMLLAGMIVAQWPCRHWARALLGGLAFGLAAAVKPIVVPLAGALAWSMRRAPRAVAWWAAGTLAAGAVLYVPLALLDHGLSGLLDTGIIFFSRWHFNCSLQALAVAVTGSTTTANLIMAAGPLAVLGLCMALGLNPWHTATVFLFMGLLFSSTVYPWYLLWALAMVPIRFDPAVWVFSLTIAWSYSVLGHPTQWHVAPWVLALEYLPVYAVLGWQVIRWFRQRRQGEPVARDGCTTAYRPRQLGTRQ